MELIEKKKTVEISLKLAPEEIATIAAACGVTSSAEREEAGYINSKHQLSPIDGTLFFNRIEDLYNDLREEGYYNA